MARRSKLIKDLTDDFLSDRMDEDRAEGTERFSQRSKHHQKNKTARTAAAREEAGDVGALPLGRVVQVFSRLAEVVGVDGQPRLCGLRKTISQRGEDCVVGDRVRYRDDPTLDASGKRTGTIERVEPRATILTRADSFKALQTHPIVANAEQMLIVAAVVMPAVKWGLIDRMIIAARAGRLEPILCLNKIDLLNVTTLFDEVNPEDDEIPPHPGDGSPAALLLDAREKLAHYRTLKVRTIETSVTTGDGIGELKETLAGKTTVLAGHSGVGKSSLVRAVEPALGDIRVGEISQIHFKGKHTTTSARIYPLTTDPRGGEVIDTPGVKLFGLWNVTEESLDDFFPDVVAEDAPAWREESYARIVASLGTHRRG
jgi:ribosome biogenesis GTPase